MTEHCPACGVVIKDKKSRSKRSHDHFFARVVECWETMPDDLKERFPNAEYLRKWALVKSGYCNQTTFVLESKDDTKNVITLVRTLDPFSIIIVRDNIVTVYTAKSQSLKDMGAKDFQESKDAIFRVIGELLGTDVSEAA